MMKQFGRTMLTVIAPAVVAAVFSSIPAQAAPNVVKVSNGLSPSVFYLNSAETEAAVVSVQSTGNTSYMLIYQIIDFTGGFSAMVPVRSRFPASTCREAR